MTQHANERQPKATCPHCGHWDSRVMQGWTHPAGYTRRRKCAECQRVYRTRELVITLKRTVTITERSP